jgi:hypothetical protein
LQGSSAATAIQSPVTRELANSTRQGDSTLNPTPQLRVKVAIANQRCEALCTCQCHVRYRFRTQGWIAAAVGALFLNYHATPNLEVRPCNSPRCKRSNPSSSTKLTYYFPTWMMRKALALSMWNQFSGGGAKWVIETPREIPAHRPCWRYIQSGDSVALQNLLECREMSPYDIDHEGRSVLNVRFAFAAVLSKQCYPRSRTSSWADLASTRKDIGKSTFALCSQPKAQTGTLEIGMECRFCFKPTS